MVVLAHIASQNSGYMQIIFDYDAALASCLLTYDLLLLVWKLLLVVARPSRQLVETYVSSL